METIYLIGGTTEAHRAVTRLEQEGYRVVVSVATALGETRAVGADTETGRKSARQLADRAASHGASAFIDCSHPFAVQASEEARLAAGFVDLPYLRYCRPPSPKFGSGVSVVRTWKEAVDILTGAGGRSLLTIGTRNLAPFVDAGLEFTVRVLPVPESLDECSRLGIGPEKIIAAYPPYSVDFNRACIRHARASALLTKDSGIEGGLPEKIEAAAAETARTIIVSRPEEPGAIVELDTLVESLRQALTQNRTSAKSGGSKP
ncbi:MAG: precorrin-6A reductase [Thermoleophilia bacterium]|jgi:precorrin-6x reductase